MNRGVDPMCTPKPFRQCMSPLTVEVRMLHSARGPVNLSKGGFGISSLNLYASKYGSYMSAL